ncbi:MAG: hypothetical protein V1791_07365 [Pseudomonadota bacterium]
MTPISRTSVQPCKKQTARKTTLILLSLLALLISTTGCSKRYVVVDGGATVTIKKSELDRVYQDNELLLKALEECRGGR